MLNNLLEVQVKLGTNDYPVKSGRAKRYAGANLTETALTVYFEVDPEPSNLPQPCQITVLTKEQAKIRGAINDKTGPCFQVIGKYAICSNCM